MAITSTYLNSVTTSQFAANTFTTGDQLLPQVTGLSNGGFVVAYRSGPVDAGSVQVDSTTPITTASARTRRPMTARSRRWASRR